MKSTIHMIPWPIMGEYHFQSSCVMLDTEMTTKEAQFHVQYRGTVRVLFETVDLTPEEEASLLQSIRSTFG